MRTIYLILHKEKKFQIKILQKKHIKKLFSIIIYYICL